MFKKNIKSLDCWDIALIKLSVAAAVLFIITIWPALLNLIVSTSPWYFLIAFIIFAIRPMYRMYFKK